MSRAVTGIRPTGDLSVANYVGAMRPIVDMQTTYDGPINIFVADIHGLTDQEPELVDRTRLDTVRSFLAAGVDPLVSTVYLQTQIEPQTVMLAGYLDRHVTVAELMRVPNLKEKLRPGQREETATVALARYPILMAADIFIQDATDVPVGKDQYPHIEFAREVARKFNNEYGNSERVIVIPDVMATSEEALRVVALNGDGKMSKSKPNGAIFLKDSPDEAERKIKRAQTANLGETSEALESHLLLCTQLSSPNDVRRERATNLYNRHMNGEQVMGDFKKVMADIVGNFLEDFQSKYNQISEGDVQQVLDDGGAVASNYADQMLSRTRRAMGFSR
jgi:tryptophanyl-tRNA synthetase